MKTLHLAILGAVIAIGFLGSLDNAYAPCPLGVTSCGPPPGDTVDTWTDSPFYEKNDTVLLRGHVNIANYTGPMVVRLVDPQSKTIQNFSAPVSGNQTFSLKILADFNETGQYQLVTCLNAWCDRSWFKYTAEPYKLSFNNRTFLINYKTYADLAGMDVDMNRSALVIHVANATSTGQRLVLELPRQLIDPKIGNHDASFKILVGQIQAEKYMKLADFKEIATTNESRTLAIDIPYEPTTDAAGTWDIEIKGPEIPSGPSFFLASPLQQFEYGMYAQGVHCHDGFILILKAEDGSPACVKPDTAQILIERGWAKGPVGVSAMAKPSVELNNVTASLQPVILGMSFFVNANVTNNQDAPITYYGGYTSPLSVKFDNIQTSTDGIHCLAVSRYVLGPHDSAYVQSEKINSVYNETGPDYAYAKVRFSYESNGTSSSQFASAEFPILHAIKLNCTEPFGTQMAKITSSVNVTRAIALANSSPEFQSKVRQYGNVTYTDFYNDLYPAQSCHSYWKGIEVMFTANSENGTRNIRVTEDVGLTKVLKIEDFEAVLN